MALEVDPSPSPPPSPLQPHPCGKLELIQAPGLSPFVALAMPSASLGTFQGLHPTCLGPVFPCLPQGSVLLAISISPRSSHTCQEVLVPSLPFAPGQVSPCALWGRSSPSSPWARPRVLRENNNSINSARSRKGFKPWPELERKGPGSQALPAGRELMESEPHRASQFSVPFMLVGE